MLYLCIVGSLGFHLNGVAYPNGSTVLRTDIGEGDAALQCTTDSTTCCSNVPPEMRGGEFYFPDALQVPIMSVSASQGYYRNRGSQLIRLNRWANGMTTGQFRCDIPASSGTIVSLFVNIGTYTSLVILWYSLLIEHCHHTVDISVSIASYGNNTAGGRYSLECSAAVNGSSQPTSFTWLSPLNIEVPSMMVNTTASTSTLTFDPLSLSHTGTYTCRVMLGGIEERRTRTLIVNCKHLLMVTYIHCAFCCGLHIFSWCFSVVKRYSLG